MEVLDILREDGTHTGRTAPRSEIHQKGWWHGTVHIYVYRIVDKHVEILTHLRSPHKDLYPNTWDPVLGGHIQAGATPLQTVVEEMAGEVGLTISPADLISGPTLQADKGLDKEFNYVFAYALPANAKIHLKDKEVQEVQWKEIAFILRSLQESPAQWRPTSNEFLQSYQMLQSLVK